MKQKMIEAHLDVAERYAQLSTARKMQVGAIIVKDDRIISIGYNGTAPGDDNTCEDVVYLAGCIVKDGRTYPLTRLVTRDTVIHAEANAIMKLAASSESGKGAAMFCTHSPCIACAKLIVGAGIKAFYYRNKYEKTEGIEYLQSHGVEVSQCQHYEKPVRTAMPSTP